MKYYYIIHGFMGSNIENWFPYFKEKVDSKDSLCIIPQFPISLEMHNYKEWKKLLDLYNYDYKTMDEDSVIIGHSTGSISALKYILDSKVKIDKLILVSGFNNFFAEEKDDIHNKINLSYYVDGNSIKEIKNYVNEVICIYGDNDPYIPQEVLHDLSLAVGAKEIVITNGGRLNKDSGFVAFEDILKYI